MNLYIVRYDGMWIGGRAVVFTKNESDALEKVKDDKSTSNFRGEVVRELKPTGVVYNDNGDH